MDFTWRPRLPMLIDPRQSDFVPHSRLLQARSAPSGYIVRGSYHRFGNVNVSFQLLPRVDVRPGARVAALHTRYCDATPRDPVVVLTLFPFF